MSCLLAYCDTRIGLQVHKSELFVVIFGSRELFPRYVSVVILVLVLEHFLEHRAMVFDIVLGTGLVRLSQLALQELADFVARQFTVAIFVDLFEDIDGIRPVLDLQHFYFEYQSRLGGYFVMRNL